MDYDIKDIGLADKGKLRIEWAEQNMPVLRLVRERFRKQKPLKGIRIAACLHATTETACLMQTLKEGGADTVLCASNPLSTQDDAAAALVKHFGISVFAIKGEDNATYYKHIHAALDLNPSITMDDGADLVSILHTERKSLLSKAAGGTEETTTGVVRLKSMAEKGALLSYGPDFISVGVQSARLAAKVFKGEKPAEVPSETPEKLHFVLNLRTAKAIGLKVPREGLERADRLVE